jgi:hypothetical protein
VRPSDPRLKPQNVEEEVIQTDWGPASVKVAREMAREDLLQQVKETVEERRQNEDAKEWHLHRD